MSLLSNFKFFHLLHRGLYGGTGGGPLTRQIKTIKEDSDYKFCRESFNSVIIQFFLQQALLLLPPPLRF